MLVHLPFSSSSSHLELGLGLGLLEDGLELGSLHDVALDLQLAAHEELLGVGLAGNELGEVVVAQDESDCRYPKSASCRVYVFVYECVYLTIRLLASWGSALANRTSLLQVHEPRLLLTSSVLDLESKDSAAGLDGVLLILVVLESGGDVVEGGRRRPLSYSHPTHVSQNILSLKPTTLTPGNNSPSARPILTDLVLRLERSWCIL